MTAAVSRRWLAAVAVVLGLLTASCSEGRPALAEKLEHYTDAGDGCQQVVSAITYADSSLKAAGQERYQEFDDAVRSRIAAVAGTIALEVRDLPSRRVLEQARVVESLADRTAAPDTRGARRVRLLREYRREAMQLVIECSREVPSL